MKNILIPLMFLAGTASADPVDCLQQNIFFEARNQSILGMFAVGWVTVNRVDDDFYPDTICDVVWQPSQFSWTSDGKPDTPSENFEEQVKWKMVEYIAEIVYDEWKQGQPCPIDQSTMFHADYVSPYWKDHYEQVVQIDNHIFYAPKG